MSIRVYVCQCSAGWEMLKHINTLRLLNYACCCRINKKAGTHPRHKYNPTTRVYWYSHFCIWLSFLRIKKTIWIRNAENKDRTGAFWFRNLSLRLFSGRKKDSHYANESTWCDATPIPPHASTSRTHACSSLSSFTGSAKNHTRRYKCTFQVYVVTCAHGLRLMCVHSTLSYCTDGITHNYPILLYYICVKTWAFMFINDLLCMGACAVHEHTCFTSTHAWSAVTHVQSHMCSHTCAVTHVQSHMCSHTCAVTHLQYVKASWRDGNLRRGHFYIL
jgi:hypothetical protein